MAATKKNLAIARAKAAAAARSRNATNGSQSINTSSSLTRPNTRNRGQRRGVPVEGNTAQGQPSTRGSQGTRLAEAMAEERRLQEEEERALEDEDEAMEEDTEEIELAATLARVEQLKAQKAEREIPTQRKSRERTV